MNLPSASGAGKPELGLRESKKRAARHALSWAAVRLATEHGLDRVRVDDIAAEVGVSPRTFNNYFSSKEEAICSFSIERQERLRDALLARPRSEPLWTAVVNAVAEEHSADGTPPKEYIARIRLLVQHPSLRGEFLKAHSVVEAILADAISERAGLDPGDPADATDHLHARMMAAVVGNAIRLAMEHWLATEGVTSFVPVLLEMLNQAARGLPSLTARADRTTGERGAVPAPSHAH
ncbi:TetR family transcriptional regulator [Amycolatopsis antarctica]|uniref:TetR family transcriptional regulator n=1 Tax=Amycolatopsis antarctica TaxID=1854586 RepID=A0A263D3B1_9PSEU|nr:TetR/AcrR family transcriptional regulator [Amycolatopsis antarctica]OZM72107.1 TetR family transcriptional regulator [Amycolatopsis antarctica]